MKRFIVLAAALVLALLIAPESNAVSKGGVTVNSWSLTSIRPTSFTSVDGVVTLSLTSTRRKTVISDISGTIYKTGGQAFIIGTADDITIPRGESTIQVRGHGSLISYTALLSLLANPSLNPADYTMDVICTVKTGRRRAHPVELKSVPLSDFLGK
ncbi:MAG: hypothetical protein J6037_04475 [Bacteroidales bacterium]|nr:hypothetical protein [Bacteroidales bacterium]